MISSFVRALVSAFKARRELALENVALRQQLAVLRRSVKRPRLSLRECAILSWKLKRLPTPWFDDVGKNNIKPQEKGAEMGSLLRTAKKHKKSRRLGEPEVMAREEYGELEVDVKIEMIRSLI